MIKMLKLADMNFKADFIILSIEIKKFCINNNIKNLSIKKKKPETIKKKRTSRKTMN